MKPRERGRRRIALLHLSPELGRLDTNTALVEEALRRVAEDGADWAITPELSLTGYHFDRKLGSDWIEPAPDRWTRRLQRRAAELGVVLFLGHATRDGAAGPCRNSLLVIDREGELRGVHHKQNVIPRAEDWATAGSSSTVVEVDGVRVGLLVCADAWPKEHVEALKRGGAQVLVSSATWPPGEYGPGDAWKRRSAESGLPLFVANRTGVEGDFDMREARSVLAHEGRHLAELRSAVGGSLLIDWDMDQQRVLYTQQYEGPFPSP